MDKAQVYKLRNSKQKNKHWNPRKFKFRNYFAYVYLNLKTKTKIGYFLGKYSLPKLTSLKIQSSNRLKSIEETEKVIKAQIHRWISQGNSNHQGL